MYFLFPKSTCTIILLFFNWKIVLHIYLYWKIVLHIHLYIRMFFSCSYSVIAFLNYSFIGILIPCGCFLKLDYWRLLWQLKGGFCVQFFNLGSRREIRFWVFWVGSILEFGFEYLQCMPCLRGWVCIGGGILGFVIRSLFFLVDTSCQILATILLWLN